MEGWRVASTEAGPRAGETGAAERMGPAMRVAELRAAETRAAEARVAEAMEAVVRAAEARAWARAATREVETVAAEARAEEARAAEVRAAEAARVVAVRAAACMEEAVDAAVHRTGRPEGRAAVVARVDLGEGERAAEVVAMEGVVPMVVGVMAAAVSV